MKKYTELSKSKQFVSVVAYLLCIMMFVFGISAKAYATEQAVYLSLESKNPTANVPFRMTNMFPGDSVTQYYILNVSYTGNITVNFQVSAENGEEKLLESLKIIIRQVETGQVLYEGMMADMPVLGQKLSTDSKSLTEELTYEITVGLSTSVGNEYQNEKLILNLSWWAEGDVPPESGNDLTESVEPEDRDDEESIIVSGGGSLTNPLTSDDSRTYMWLAIICVTVALMMVLIGYRRNRCRRRPFFRIFLLVFLILGLGITSVALFWQKVSVEENLFMTGNVSISINDGQPVFNEDILFEPGMVVKKEFILCNDSTCDVYYRLYFTNVDGDLAEMLQVEVLDGDTTIFEGTLAGMNGKKSEGADGIMKEGEERVMAIIFRVPEGCGNAMQGSSVWFYLNADAVQKVNNPDGLFR